MSSRSARTTLLVATLSVTGCQRVPPESFSAPTTGAWQASGPAAGPTIGASAPPARSDAGDALAERRCVMPTPAEPPPAPPPGPDPRCPPDPAPSGRPLLVAPVLFPDNPGVRVEAEIARTPEETERGLMYRRSMAEDRGMLFDLRARGQHAFWMHNTCIPLDMIFVDWDGFIVGIVENAPTLDDHTRQVACPSRWVIEVNAGWSRRHGVRAGQHVILPQSG
ncbi:MAG: DUF192 domain-containing protein [Polyangiaceae bacterium]|nr:DUF192 domain-containing protein [Polyangiaceae bacterium]